MPDRIEIAAGPRIIKCYLIQEAKRADFEKFCQSIIRPWLEAQPNVTQCDAWLMNYDGKLTLVVSMWDSDKPWDTIPGLADFLETGGKEIDTITEVPALTIHRTTEEAAKAYSDYLVKVIASQSSPIAFAASK